MNDWNEFIAQFGAVPNLAGAQCRGRTELFDATIETSRERTLEEVEYARAAAKRLCGTCPALNPCRQWLDSLPRTKKPPGVVAGRLNDDVLAQIPVSGEPT